MSQAQADVVVIGAGVAGLTAAVALSDQGLRVTVVEREELPGGRARSCTDYTTGDRIDIGPHILLTDYRKMLRWLQRLGTDSEVVWQDYLPLVDPPHSVSMRVRPLPAPLQFLPSLLKVKQLSWVEMLSNLPVLWQALRLSSADVRALDDRPALDHLQQMGVRPKAIDWFWRSACMTILNVPLEACSAGALLHFIQYMAGRSGYRVGFAAGGLGDLFAPAAQAVIEAAGGEVRLQTDVQRIQAGNQGITLGLGDDTQIDARWCIAALPPQDLLKLLPEAWRGLQAFSDLPSFTPSPYISSYLWFDRKLTQERFWARVWSPTNLNYDCYDLSNIRPEWRGRPSVIASNIIYSHRAAELTDDEIVQQTLRELADFVPEIAGARVIHSRVHRIAMAKPCPTPGMEQKRPNVQTPVPGLFLAGDWINTGLPGSMESASRAGNLAAEALLNAAGRPCSLASPLPELEGLARVLGGGR